MSEDDRKYEMFIVPTNEVLSIWHIARELLSKGIDRSSGRWNLEYVLAELVLGKQTLWLVREIILSEIVGAATMQISQYPNRRMLAMHFLGGKDLDKWYSEVAETVFEYGRKAGCTAIETIGREGLWKWYKTSGFKKNGICYELEL
jgi:hypothetical protein